MAVQGRPRPSLYSFRVSPQQEAIQVARIFGKCPITSPELTESPGYLLVTYSHNGKTKKSGKIDLKDSDVFFEIDHYFDEKWKFGSAIKQAPFMIKNDDDMTSEKVAKIKAEIDKIETTLYAENASEHEIGEHIDLESFAKCFIVQIALMQNSDFSGPNSFFCVLSGGKLKVPTVWDFDYSFLGCTAEKCLYFDKLRKSERFKNEVLRVWKLSGLGKDEILTYAKSKKAKIEKAVRKDGKKWEFHAPSGGLKPGEIFLQFSFEKESQNLLDNLSASFDAFNAHIASGQIE